MARKPAKPIIEHADYLTKSDASLLYIARDARAAADAMRGWNPKAEGKYLDEMNDALTVMAYRRRLAEAGYHA